MLNESILERVVFGNSINMYLLLFSTFLICVFSIKLFEKIFLRRLRAYAKTTATDLDDFLIDILEKTVMPFLYILAAYFNIKGLTLHPSFEKDLSIAQMGVTIFFIAKLATMVFAYGFKAYMARQGCDANMERSFHGIVKALKFLVWALAAIFFLDNLGFKISTIIAGLGIGGVAVAIAAQALLKDFFSYFSIIFDSPFKLGDFIIVGDHMGTVEHIGIKTTRIRSLSGELVVFSNTDLTDSRVRNYRVMEKRRVLFRLGVLYDTTLGQLKEIPEMLKGIISKIENATFDRAHFFSYGDFSLIFEIVYYVAGSDYNKYMDIQQEINLRIKEEFEKKNIKFAYPTQTLYLNMEGPPNAERAFASHPKH